MSEPWANVDVVHGAIFPPRANPPALTTDARTRALKAFAAWIATLRFQRAGNANGLPIGFRIPLKRIYIEQPDPEVEMHLPSIVFLGGPGNHILPLGGGVLNDATQDLYCPGTAVLEMGEYEEPFKLEVWGAHKATHHAIRAALEVALMSYEGSSALRLKMPEYYGSTVTIRLDSQEGFDEPDVARNRRRSQLGLVLAVPVCRLVNAVTLRPYICDLDGDTDP